MELVLKLFTRLTDMLDWRSQLSDYFLSVDPSFLCHRTIVIERKDCLANRVWNLCQ